MVIGPPVSNLCLRIRVIARDPGRFHHLAAVAFANGTSVPSAARQ